MSLIGVIGSFATGTYAVTRRAPGAYDANGRFTPGGTSALNIEASIQPVTGRDLQVLPEGFSAEETKVVYTTTTLRTESPAGAADIVTIDSEPYKVIRSERWEAFGDEHHRAFVARGKAP